MNEGKGMKRLRAVRACAKFGGGLLAKGDEVVPSSPRAEEFYRRRLLDGDLTEVTHAAKGAAKEK